MLKRKFIIFSLIVLTTINIIIFFFRGSFDYQAYATYSSLYGECESSCNQKWKQFIADYPKNELAESKIITDSIVAGSKTTVDKIVAMGNFIYNRFNMQLGRPSVALLVASPLSQYKTLSASIKEELWCGNFAQMFSYFCWSQDIVCRNIEIMNAGDRHVVNECYLPETKQWILVDLTSNLLLVKTGALQKDLTGFIDFRKKIKHLPSFSLSSVNGKPVTKSIDPNASFINKYYNKETLTFFYSRISNEKVYSTANKVKRYVLPVSWYEIFVNEKKSNFPFYLKVSFLLLWILSFVLLMITQLKFKL